MVTDRWYVAWRTLVVASAGDLPLQPGVVRSRPAVVSPPRPACCGRRPGGCGPLLTCSLCAFTRRTSVLYASTARLHLALRQSSDHIDDLGRYHASNVLVVAEWGGYTLAMRSPIDDDLALVADEITARFELRRVASLGVPDGLVGEEGDAVVESHGVDQAHGFLVTSLAEEALASRRAPPGRSSAAARRRGRAPSGCARAGNWRE